MQEFTKQELNILLTALDFHMSERNLDAEGLKKLKALHEKASRYHAIAGRALDFLIDGGKKPELVIFDDIEDV